MAQNKNALIRYRTIDKCLQNRNKQWTLNDLIEACSDALYEYEGRDVNVSKRTVQLDIQMMRSDKLGYNAPIEVYQKKYYHYSDPEYTITDIPLNEGDMDVLAETVEMLKQFKDFSLFDELGGIIHRLEDKIYTEKTNRSPVIHLDKNENLKGLEHLDTLYHAIVKKMVLKITYKSFKAKKPHEYIFHPYLLKEFNNRWFLVGKGNKQLNRPFATIALDRIISVEYDTSINFMYSDFDPETYYDHTIGVTVMEKRQLCETRLRISPSNAPYVITKPFHASQKIVQQNENGSIDISLFVDYNFEFERLILGFGEHIEVLAPKNLRKHIKKKLEKAAEVYEK